jgi:CRISPR-associated protein Cas2
MFCVVAYDISDNRRRTRLFKLMKGYGVHTQFSVFECDLTDIQYARMLVGISELVLPDEDNIKVYQVCKSCLRSMHLFGKAKSLSKPDCIII